MFFVYLCYTGGCGAPPFRRRQRWIRWFSAKRNHGSNQTATNGPGDLTGESSTARFSEPSSGQGIRTKRNRPGRDFVAASVQLAEKFSAVISRQTSYHRRGKWRSLLASRQERLRSSWATDSGNAECCPEVEDAPSIIWTTLAAMVERHCGQSTAAGNDLDREEWRWSCASGHRPLFLIDMRAGDIAPDAQRVENVFIRHRRPGEVVAENVRMREQELAPCRSIIEKHTLN